MKKLIALFAAVMLAIALAPLVKADNSVLGTGKAKGLKKQVEAQGSAGTTTVTNAPKPKANSAPKKP